MKSSFTWLSILDQNIDRFLITTSDTSLTVQNIFSAEVATMGGPRILASAELKQCSFILSCN